MENLLQQNRAFIFLCVITAIAAGCMPVEFASPVLIAGLGLFIGLILISTRDAEDRDFLIPAFIAVFLARLAFVIFLFNFICISNGTGQLGDAWSYSINGRTILDLWFKGLRGAELARAAFVHSASGALTKYDFWNAVVYYFAGKNLFAPIFINCLVVSLTGILTYDIAKWLCDKKAAMIAFLLTAFCPSLFFWSAQNLKEPISLFLTSVLIWTALRLKIQFRFYLLFLLLVFSAALGVFRTFLLIAFYISLPVSLLFYLGRLKKNFIPYLVMTIFIFFIMVICINTIKPDFIVRKMLYFFGEATAPTEKGVLLWLYSMREGRTLDAGSALLTSLKFENPLSYILAGMPLMLLAGLLAPFPWMLGSMFQIMAVPEMILFYFLIPSIFSGGKFIIKYRLKEGAILLAYIIIMYLILGISEGNAGTLFRHRSIVLPFVFILVAVGLSHKNKSVKKDYAVS